MDLPGELRNRIYELVFDKNAEISVHPEFNSWIRPPPSPLTQTSRLIRAETLPYASNSFRFYFTAQKDPSDSVDTRDQIESALHTWVTRLASNRVPHLRRLVINVDFQAYNDDHRTRK